MRISFLQLEPGILHTTLMRKSIPGLEGIDGLFSTVDLTDGDSPQDSQESVSSPQVYHLVN